MRITNIKLKTSITKKNIILMGFMYIRDKKSRINRKNIKLEVNGEKYKITYPIKRIKISKILDILSNFYIVKIPVENLLTANIHNKVYFVYKTKRKKKKFALRYSILSNKTKYLNSKVKILKNIGTSLYVRQSVKNKIFITVRQTNVTDKFSEKIKIDLACLLSKIMKKDKIIMYEKEANRFEESASIVYKNLIDEGYKNVYYIINKNSPQTLNVDEKYKNKFIYKYSFKHYLAFFSAKALIGTESPGHAIELRVANKHAARRIYSNDFKYVFLQHGVMYMVSLDAKGRSFFRKDGGMPDGAKIVVSSQEEANHFVELGGFCQDDLYMTGLPKFDKNQWNDNADKITIMLTWRPWEFNLLRNDLKNSPYYKILREIISSIPNKLKGKIILMPHPLILDALRNSSLSKYIKKNFVYDEVLRETKILITDYSSIAYDAFYRGSNVIFYWKEKDYCMEQYGGHLMLNNENVFGYTCYNKKELTKAINIEYVSKQDEKFINKYRKIVEFHDNKNTNRLIEQLKKDQIIEKT